MYLNCHSYYSFLYGTLSPKKLIEQAKRYGIDRLVLTDINNTSGNVQAIRLAKELGVDVILGTDFRNKYKQQYIAIARNQNGFEQINRHLSHHLKTEIPFQQKCPLEKDVFVVYPFQSHQSYSLNQHEYIGINNKDLHYLRLKKWENLLHKMVVLHPVSLRKKSDHKLHKLLRCINENTIISKIKDFELANENEVFLDEFDFELSYAQYPLIIQNTAQLLKNCHNINFEFGANKNKAKFNDAIDLKTARKKDYNQLISLVQQGAIYRYKTITPIIKERIEKELSVIKTGNYVSYFLINHDIISFAQKNKFFYIGRGSGANSIVAYCLKITNVDPIELDLYFERFLNVFRKTPPDFDIDFSWQDRDQVIQYIFDKYGIENTCLQATYTTFQVNSSIRELGKVYGLPTEEIEILIENVKKGGNSPMNQSLYQEILKYAEQIKKFPKNLSIHAGGILISEKPIYTYTATSHPPKGFPICQFDMYGSEELGLYKFDILSQRGLGHIKDSISIIKENKGIDIDIHDIPKFMKDEKIKNHLEKGDLVGCFYVESPAMRMLLAKLECKDYHTLVAASSIIRPGVSQSGMMREYILRHHMPDKGKSVAHPVLWNIMSDTYGVMVYQEDVIKVASQFAGLGLSESDILRRSMSGKFRSKGEFLQVKNAFINNCLKKGHTKDLTIEVWRQIESFAGYSFAKGHSASFAVESYQSMYLKAYYPLEFMVAVINNFGGFYRTGIYVQEAQKKGAIVKAPCINKSHLLTNIQNNTIYLGFIHVKGLESNLIQNILEERNLNGIYTSLQNFIDRVKICLEQLIVLIRIKGFQFTNKSKQTLLWEIHLIFNKKSTYNSPNKLFESCLNKKVKTPELHYDLRNDMLDELEFFEFILSPPFKLLANQNIIKTKAKEIKRKLGKEIEIIGQLITTKNVKTKNNQIMYFGTFLDLDGLWIDTVIFPNTAKKYKMNGFGCYLIKGKATKEFNFYSLEVTYLEKLGWWNALDEN